MNLLENVLQHPTNPINYVHTYTKCSFTTKDDNVSSANCVNVSVGIVLGDIVEKISSRNQVQNFGY